LTPPPPRHIFSYTADVCKKRGSGVVAIGCGGGGGGESGKKSV